MATRVVKPWWIKQRYNPQLGVYFIKMGQMSKTAAKKHEKAIYGSNTMLRYESENDYLRACHELNAD